MLNREAGQYDGLLGQAVLLMNNKRKEEVHVRRVLHIDQVWLNFLGLLGQPVLLLIAIEIVAYVLHVIHFCVESALQW